MNQHISHTNFIPYLLIIIMGFMLYIAYDEIKESEARAEHAEKEAETAMYNLGVIQSYNEQRFEELSKVRNKGWKRGKHKSKF